MDEDSDDKFYDSLDETPQQMPHQPSNEEGSTSCLFMSDVCEVQSCTKNSVFDDNDDLASLIPLYDGEVQKSGTLSNRRLKRTPKSLELLEGSKSRSKGQGNSYVALFRSRIGYPTERSRRTITDSARALDGDLTRRTVEDETRVVEVFEDAQEEAAEDTQSFYENILKNSQKSSEKIAVTSKSNTLRAVTATSLDSSSIMELHSVSEQALCCSGSVPSKRSTKKRVLPPDPIVGKLGPDIMAMKEKLENWKRRQSYGLTASQKNRIKIKETKVLKELKAEVTKETHNPSSSN